HDQRLGAGVAFGQPAGHEQLIETNFPGHAPPIAQAAPLSQHPQKAIVASMNIAPTTQRVSKLVIPALCLLIGACAPAVEQPQPAPATPPPAAKPAAPLPPEPENWINAPRTAGDWSYRATPT